MFVDVEDDDVVVVLSITTLSSELSSFFVGARSGPIIEISGIVSIIISFAALSIDDQDRLYGYMIGYMGVSEIESERVVLRKYAVANAIVIYCWQAIGNWVVLKADIS